MAVERPPIGKNPRNLEKGLEKMTTSGVICGGHPRCGLGPERMHHQSGVKHLADNNVSHVYHRGRSGRGRGREWVIEAFW